MSIDMPTDIDAPSGTDDEVLAADSARWAGTPLASLHWLETPEALPPGAGIETAGDAIVATARGRVLTQADLDTVTAFAEFLAGVVFPAEDTAELEDDMVDAFEDSPAVFLRELRPMARGLQQVRASTPIERATRRAQALGTTYAVELRRQADGDDPGPVLDVVMRHNPVVRYWRSADLVLVADAVESRLDQHRMALALVGQRLDDPDALRDRLLTTADEALPIENGELVASEVRLLCLRAWLRDLGTKALDRLRAELDRSLASALDVDLVVQQLGYRASVAVGARLTQQARRSS